MKLVSYLKDENEQLGVLIDDRIYDVELIHPDIPHTMNMFLNYWEELLPLVQAGELAILDRETHSNKSIPWESVSLLAPVPLPSSCRDGYAFRQHVAAACWATKTGWPRIGVSRRHSAGGLAPGALR